MSKIRLFAFAIVLLMGACSPRITTNLSKSYSPLDYKEEVKVYGLNESVPSKSEELGIVKVDDTGFTTKCGYEDVINAAKLEARKVGGNAIKIIEHLPPSTFGSSCHRIMVKVLKVTDFGSPSAISKEDSILAKADYALLHVYRFGGMGAFIGYDLYLGDSVICRVSNNWKKTIRIKKDGMNTLWARTEVKKEIPVNIKIGKAYYLRCSIEPGVFVGHPRLQIVSNDLGKGEFDAIKGDKTDLGDLLFMKDGREINCKILSEDEANIYFLIIRNGKETKTQLNKNSVKSIQRGE